MWYEKSIVLFNYRLVFKDSSSGTYKTAEYIFSMFKKCAENHEMMTISKNRNTVSEVFLNASLEVTSDKKSERDKFPLDFLFPLNRTSKLFRNIFPVTFFFFATFFAFCLKALICEAFHSWLMIPPLRAWTRLGYFSNSLEGKQY